MQLSSKSIQSFIQFYDVINPGSILIISIDHNDVVIIQ